MMIINSVLLILFISLSFYVLFGGADYGAGIVACTSIFNKKTKIKELHIISKAIGPVWEANHIWLILVIVILFVGFPEIYYRICTDLHWPITMILIGIVTRGTTFTFMHYDPDQSKSFKIYHPFFSLSSLWTAFWLGVTVASLNFGLMGSYDKNYWNSYIAPWFHLYGLSVGFFSVFIFAFLASVFLMGETKNRNFIDLFSRKAKIFFLIVVINGLLVFFFSQNSSYPLAQRFFSSKISISCITLASLAVPFMYIFLKKRWIWSSKITAATIVVSILSGWIAADFPNIIYLPKQESINFYNSCSDEIVLKQMLQALVFGIIIIFPSLLFLMYTFKKGK